MNETDFKMFPSLSVGSLHVFDRPNSRLMPDTDRPLTHPALRPNYDAVEQSRRYRPESGAVRSQLDQAGPANPPARPIFQGLPLSTVAPGLNMNMFTAASSLAISASSATGGLIPPLLQYPGLLPTSEELKFLSMAQFQAANQAHLVGEVAKLKPPILTRNYLELAMLVCNTFRGKLFPCPHCRYVTDRRNNLKRHVATMHQACDKQLECCGVSFATKASLREHITIFHHNGYSCPFCGRRFCRKALLKRHLSVHSGQKDYTCPHCDYATSHKSNLERHKRIHARIQIMGDSGMEDAHQDAGMIFEEKDTGDFPLHEMGIPSRTYKSCITPTNEDVWSESRNLDRGRISPTHSDDTEDCEIDIDDDSDDGDVGDVIVDADISTNNGGDNSQQQLCGTRSTDAIHHPINLVTESNSRATAAAKIAARLTHGFAAPELKMAHWSTAGGCSSNSLIK